MKLRNLHLLFVISGKIMLLEQPWVIEDLQYLSFQPSFPLRVEFQKDNSLYFFAILLCICVSRERLTRQKRKPFTVVNRELANCPQENIWMNKQNLRSLEILYERHVEGPQEIIYVMLRNL